MQVELSKLLNVQEIKTLQSALGEDADLHIVGGAIRDIYLGKAPHDLDLATKLHPEEVIKRLEQSNIRAVPLGIRRGTVAAIINHECFEITTFRNPSQESDYTETILEDLPARDFTINAMALSLNTGDLIDPFNGREDLDNNIVRTVGDPRRRFIEDPHRIFRLVRFGVGSDRTVHPETLQAAKELAPLLQEEKVERLGMELVKIMLMPKASECLREMHRIGILEIVLPEIIPCIGLEQNHHHKFDVFEHTLAVIDGVDPDNLKVRLAALFHDIGKPESCHVLDGVIRMLGHEEVSERITKEVLPRLKFSSHIVEDVALLVKLHMKPVIGMKGRGRRRLIKALGDRLVDDWLALKKADILGGRNLQYDFDEVWTTFEEKMWQERFRTDVPSPTAGLNLGGKHLIQLGVPQGPVMGEILLELSENVLDDPTLNVEDTLLELARAIWQSR